jgi:hypothetical protein
MYALTMLMLMMLLMLTNNQSPILPLTTNYCDGGKGCFSCVLNSWKDRVLNRYRVRKVHVDIYQGAALCAVHIYQGVKVLGTTQRSLILACCSQSACRLKRVLHIRTVGGDIIVEVYILYKIL